MADKPRGFESAAQRAMQLIAADTLLAGAHEIGGLKPKMQRQMAALENRALAHSELAFAVVALPQAKPLSPLRVLLARLAANALERVDSVGCATVLTDRSIRPNDSLQRLKRCRLIREIGFGKNAGHDRIPCYGLKLPP